MVLDIVNKTKGVLIFIMAIYLPTFFFFFIFCRYLPWIKRFMLESLERPTSIHSYDQVWELNCENPTISHTNADQERSRGFEPRTLISALSNLNLSGIAIETQFQGVYDYLSTLSMSIYKKQIIASVIFNRK